MRFLSVCSGIDAASVAWAPLGWKAVAFSEIEPFPSAVLAHWFPDVPNWGDMTKFQEWPDANVDVLVGGTPCQSFSVAGLRKGLADPRGNLALTYLAITDRYRPEWLLWENVPGVLSSNGGRDFGAFLGGLVELGYGFAYRVLDAQYVRVDGFGRAVPQRRRRVFVVGHSDPRRAAAVLFDAASLCGDPAPRREAREGIAPTLSARTKGGGGLGTDFDCDGGLIASTGNVPHCLNAGGMGRQDYETETMIAHSLRAEGFDASEDGTGRGTPLVPMAFSCKDHGADAQSDLAPTMRAMGHAGSHANAGGQLAVAFDLRGREGGAMPEGPHDTANIRAASGGSSRSYVAAYQDVAGTLKACGGKSGLPNGAEECDRLVGSAWAVRRLMPIECERLQGFPDGYTDVPYRGKSAADGPRYKALGNSMAVNVMRWLGRRIEMVHAISAHKAAAE